MNTISKYIEKLFSFFIIETLFLVVPFLSFWWIFYLFNWNVLLGILIGVLVTILLNIFFLEKLFNSFYSINYYCLILIHLFFSVCIFGFFMGVPVFNILPGIFGAFYIANRSKIQKKKEEEFKHDMRIGNIFSTIVLVGICFCSGYIAISDEYTASNLEGMFSLPFHITDCILWIIILVGGFVLLLIQYFLSVIVAKRVYSGKRL